MVIIGTFTLHSRKKRVQTNNDICRPKVTRTLATGNKIHARTHTRTYVYGNRTRAVSNECHITFHMETAIYLWNIMFVLFTLLRMHIVFLALADNKLRYKI